MIRRLASFAETNPKNAAKVIFALAIAFVAFIVGVLAAFLDIGSLFEPAYPSETTPLSWNGGSVMWTAVDTVIFSGSGYSIATGDDDPSDLYAEYGGWGRNYSDMQFSWQRTSGTMSGAVANDSEQQELSAGVVATIESYVGGTIVYDQEINYSLVITDLQGNGAFDRGDQITFKVSPYMDAIYYEDEIYTIALVYGIDPWYLYVGEFSFAFHEGTFYSWESSELNWSQPWWEH